MAGVVEMLRTIRSQWGLSLRDVKERSKVLAHQWGSRTYEGSFSWLAKLEGGEHDMTVPQLISLATIYSKPPEDLLRVCLPKSVNSNVSLKVADPNTAILLMGGAIERRAQDPLPDEFRIEQIPGQTMLLLWRNRRSRALIAARSLIAGIGLSTQ